MTTELQPTTEPLSTADRCVLLWSKGLTLRQIAAEVGVTFQAVHQHLERRGVSKVSFVRRRAAQEAQQAKKKRVVATCESCGATLKRPPRADGHPRFCVQRPECRAAKMRYYYAHKPEHREKAKAYAKTPHGRELARAASRKWMRQHRAQLRAASTIEAAPVPSNETSS